MAVVDNHRKILSLMELLSISLRIIKLVAGAIMSLYLLIALFSIVYHRSQAFTASLPCRDVPSVDATSVRRSMAPLSQEEIFARMQQKPVMDDAPPVFLYDEAMLADMEAVLLALEKRVQEGPGALTSTEIDQLDIRLHKIIHEMKLNEHKPRTPPQQASTTTTTSTTTTAAAPVSIDTDTDLQDDKAYDGYGFGQARDTVNTYVIPGMDEMSAEEYQVALQQSVINRQQRRVSSGMATGNRASWDYLNSLKTPSSPRKTPWSKESNTSDEEPDH
jgi:hypothetical protein